VLEVGGATIRVRSDPRGIVGAAASIAWPGHHPTWELISYRSPDRGGRARLVEVESVRTAAAAFPSLFLCYDERTRRMLVAPHTPCPILFGLRGTDPRDLPRAARLVRSEPVERWLSFRSNQGTGDHLIDRRFEEVGPFLPARIRGRVSSLPETLQGGHVGFDLAEPDGTTVRCMAFEPTKTLPKLARQLRPGDSLTVWGGRGEDPTFRLEGIVVRRWGDRPVAAPPCPDCRRRIRSLGTGRGYRCPGCRRRFPPEFRRTLRGPPPDMLGPYHPTPSARRHLAPRAPDHPSTR